MAIEAGIRLTAKNETARAFQEFERNGRRSAGKVAQEFEKANRAMRRVGMALTGFGVIGTALIVKTTLLASRVETLGVVMNQVGKTAGFTADEMADFEKGVRDMGITTQVARSSLIKLIQANIDLSNASKLARVAQDAAVIGGINSSEAFERIVDGINRLNPLILKTMGITISLEQAYGDYAKTTGIAVEEIDSLTKKQIAVNEVLEAGVAIAGSYEAAMDTANKRMFSLARLAEEAQLALGQAFLPAFVQVIDAVSAAFKAFNSLNPAIQKTIGYSIAAGTAFAAITGPLLILASKAPGIISSMSAVGTVFFNLGANVSAAGVAAGSATRLLSNLAPALGALAVAAIAATAVIALAVAIGMLVNFIVDLNDKQKTLIDLTKEHEKELRKSSVSFQVYDKEMRRVIRDVGGFNLGQAKFNRLMREGGEEAVAAALDINFFGEQALVSMREAESATDGWAVSLQTAAEKAAIAEAVSQGLAESTLALADAQEEAKRGLDDLNTMISGPLDSSFVQFKDRIGDLRKEERELIEDIEELESKTWLSDAQEEELSALRTQLGEVRGAISDVTREHDIQTRQIIFNMIAQRLAMSDLPFEDQFAALRELAGKWDLIGPKTQEAMQIADSALAAFLESGNLQMFLDVLSRDYNISVGVNFDFGGISPEELADIAGRPRPGSGGGGGGGGRGGGGGGKRKGGEKRQTGGPLNLGAWTLVGEAGAELITPWGTVLDASTSRKIMAGGLRPDQAFALIPDGGGGGSIVSSGTQRRIVEQGRRQQRSSDIARETQRRIAEAERRDIGGGGGATITQTVAATASAVTTATQQIAEETAAVIGAATAGLGTQILGMTRSQTEQLRTLIRDQNLSAEQIRLLLEDIRQVLQDQGTAFDMAQAVNEGLQTADFQS